MALFKCKMCGGNLEITEGMTVCECEYCGTKQTVPKTRDDVASNLFNRANNLRIKCEFDKAQEIYDKIVASDPSEAEAYWGLVLCKYGIEYVEDPATYKKIPTCHRTQLESVMTDVDYLSAIEHADVVQRAVYEEEARAIDKLQKDILEIVHKEKPFDVFICYKETDESGKRTNDSVIANDIYYQLTTEGFKVFYAAITLEDKLGREYEPYIFAALNSAKVMLVIGSKPEYFNAVWVKNEWSRYMKLMKSDRSKLLIPCYKDMDAYDLPEEFSHLQAQDMTKIGFINDLIRGIKKVIVKEEAPKAQAPVQTVVTAPASANVENLLKRGMLALEDGKWEEANRFFEKVLDENVEEPRAYFGKMLCSYKAKNEEELVNSALADDELLPENEYYIKAYRFSNDDYKAHLADLSNRSVFSAGMKLFNSAKTEEDFTKAKLLFDRIPDNSSAKEKSDECQENIDKINAENERIRIEREQEQERLRILAENKKKKRMRISAIISAAVVLVVAFSVIYATVIVPNLKYKDAILLMDEGKYTEAISAFEEMNGYKDSKEQISNCYYEYGVSSMESKEYFDAITAFRKVNDYKNAKELLVKCLTDLNKTTISGNYTHAVALRNDGTVVTTEEEQVLEWQDIVAVSAGSLCSVGVKADGTVVATGTNRMGECNVSDWTDIVAVSAGKYHTVGLKSDGTVVAAGINVSGECDVSDWTDIVAVSVKERHTIGLKSDGTVVATGNNDYGQCDVSGWTDIVSVSTGFDHTIGLKADGTVLATGRHWSGQCDVSEWTDIVAVSAGECFTVGVKSDGTVVATGDNENNKCNVSSWEDIVAVSTGASFTIGLKSDGTLACTQRFLGFSDWTNIKTPND
ncbi:MAG: TIR domain-containing protein [Oscillospiraceae bacterium]